MCDRKKNFLIIIEQVIIIIIMNTGDCSDWSVQVNSKVKNNGQDITKMSAVRTPNITPAYCTNTIQDVSESY